ncbi:TPA: hypothetical protein DIC39_03880 [Patescibacteria group bacterium]|nr:hypothetical protein [Patescibacteria group bacterium]HCU48162.1 hypothetical protein [Patescibacteria group bacterium]
MYHIETRGDNTVGFKTFLHSRIVAGDVSATADVGCYLLDDGVKFSVLPDAVTIYAEEERQIAALLRKIPAAARRGLLPALRIVPADKVPPCRPIFVTG